MFFFLQIRFRLRGYYSNTQGQIIKVGYLKCVSYILLAFLLLAFNTSVSAEILGQWLLNGNAKDTSGKDKDGEIIGKAGWVDGKFGKALELDGTTTGLKIAPGLTFDQFTAALYVNSAKEWGISRTEIWAGSKKYGDAVLIRGDERGAWKNGEAMLHWTDGAGGWFAIGSGKLDQDKWYHLAGTFDGTTLKFYLDGKLVGQEDTKIGTGDTSTFIGCHPAPTNYFQGTIDDVAVYDHPLSADEIKKIATMGLASKSTAVRPVRKLSTQWSRIKSSN